MAISGSYTGLSPSMVRRSRRLLLPKLRLQMIQTPHLSKVSHGDSVCPIPFSFATTNGISFDFFSSGYLDVSVLRVISLNLCIQFKVTHKVLGFPIRKFTDQNLHTAPRNLSQYTTSFIGFQCQGIRHTPLNA